MNVASTESSPSRKKPIAKQWEGRNRTEADQRWERGRSWTLASFFESGDGREANETVRGMEIQKILIECLELGESMVFRFGRDREGGLAWGLRFRSPDPDRWRSVKIVLRSLEHGLEFRHQDSGPMSDRWSRRWLELLPETEALSKTGSRVGFGEDFHSASGDGIIEVPALRWDRRLQRLPYFLAEYSELKAIEVAVEPIEETGLEEEVASAIGSRVRRPNPGNAFKLLESWSGNLSEGRRFALRCRVAFEDGETSPDAWADVFGREIYRAEAVLAGDTPERKPPEVSRHFGGDDLPLLIPPFELLREAGILRRYNRRIPKLPAEGVVAGQAGGSLLRLPEVGRERHTYVVGATGTGKSTMLFNLIHQDLENGEGVILLDPHGDLCEQVFYAVPEERADDVVVIDPGATGPVPGFNPLDLPNDRFRDIRASYIVGEFIRLFHQLWDVPEAFGPIFELYFRNALLLLMRNRRASDYSLKDFPGVFLDKDFRRQAIHFAELPSVKAFWRNMAEKTTGEMSLENVAPYIASKLDCFVHGGFLPEVVSRPETTLNFEEIMDGRKILLVNLNKGLIGDRESRILGMLLITQIFSTALGRSLRPESERVPCHLYVDEFQNFVSDGMAEMLSEARKFGLRLTLANQTLQQLTAHRGTQNVLDSVLGNVGNLFAFRLGIRDSETLEPFTRPFTPAQMQRLPNFHAFARVLDAGGPIEPVVMETLPMAS